MTQLQAKEGQRLPANQKLGEKHETVSSTVETNPANILILDFQPQNCKKINFCCIRHPVCDTSYGSPSKQIQNQISNCQHLFLFGMLSVHMRTASEERLQFFGEGKGTTKCHLSPSISYLYGKCSPNRKSDHVVESPNVSSFIFPSL